MNKFFIELSDSVTTLFTKGRLIVGIEDFDYSEDFVDQLYSRMFGLPIDEVIVINHGVIDNFANSNVAKFKGLSFRESKTDREAIMHILDVLKIDEYDFIEFASYYTSIQEEAIIIEKIDNKVNVIANLRDRAYVEICTEDNVYDIVRAMQNKYQITKLIDISSYVVPAYVSYFKNAGLLKDDKEALVSLSRFGYTMTEGAVTSGSIKNLVFTDVANFVEEQKESQQLFDEPAIMVSGTEGAVGQAAVSAEELTDDLSTVDDLTAPEEASGRKMKKRKPAKASDKKPKEKKAKEKKPKEKKKFGLPLGLSMFFIFLNIVLPLGSMIGVRYLNNTLVDKQLVLNELSKEYYENSSQLEAYKVVEGTDTKLSGYTVVKDIFNLKDLDDIVINAGTDTVNVSGSFKKKTSAEKFMHDVTKKYEVSDKSIKKDSKDYKVLFDISLL